MGPRGWSTRARFMLEVACASGRLDGGSGLWLGGGSGDATPSFPQVLCRGVRKSVADLSFEDVSHVIREEPLSNGLGLNGGVEAKVRIV